ncbi:MAG: prepilin peptidase [Promethearchaeota archaeon]
MILSLNCFPEIYILILFLVFIYDDIKFRRISNRFIILNLFIGIFLNNIVMLSNKNNWIYIVLIRIYFLSLISIILFLLYSIKIIGGGDGKAIFVIFLNKPLSGLHGFYFVNFFLFFFMFLLVYLSLNIITNHFSNSKWVFKQYFLINNIKSIHHKIHYKSNYRFYPLVQFKTLNKKGRVIKPKSILFNQRRNQLEIMIQYRFALMILFFLSYYFCFFNISF